MGTKAIAVGSDARPAAKTICPERARSLRRWNRFLVLAHGAQFVLVLRQRRLQRSAEPVRLEHGRRERVDWRHFVFGASPASRRGRPRPPVAPGMRRVRRGARGYICRTDHSGRDETSATGAGHRRDRLHWWPARNPALGGRLPRALSGARCAAQRFRAFSRRQPVGRTHALSALLDWPLSVAPYPQRRSAPRSHPPTLG